MIISYKDKERNHFPRIKPRKKQRPFKNEEVSFSKLKKDYEKITLPLEIG